MTEPIKRETLFGVALITLILVVFYLFYRVMLPFLGAIAWGAIIVITFRPMHDWLAARIKRPGLAAFTSTLIVTLIILGPVSYLITALVGEAVGLFNLIQQNIGAEGTSWQDFVNDPLIKPVVIWIENTFNITDAQIKQSLIDNLRTLGTKVVGGTGTLAAGFFNAGFKFVLTLLTSYYLFKDGDALMESIAESIPLPEERATSMLRHVREVVKATIYGGLVVALIQGMIGGLMFWILGLHAPVLWGAVMAFLSLIPFLGAFVVFVPASVILLVGGSYIKGIILLAVGTIVVSQIDNFLRPILISGRTELHPLLLFFSIAGGLAVFGLLGLVLGPVIAAVFVAMFELYRFALRPGVGPAPATEDAADSN